MALPLRYAAWWVKNAQALTVIFCGLFASGSLIGAFTAAVRGDWASVVIALAVFVVIAAIFLSPCGVSVSSRDATGTGDPRSCRGIGKTESRHSTPADSAGPSAILRPMEVLRASLRLEHAVSTWGFQDGNVLRHPESHFLDLVVNGSSLREMVGPQAEDMVTELNRPWLPVVANAVETLMGRRPHDDLRPGRAALLVCKMCGDIGCGMLSAKLEVGPTEVTWSDFLWEDFEEPQKVEGLVNHIAFQRDEYEDVLLASYTRVAAFDYDKLAHQGRRFLWPWQWGWRLTSE